jgi:hypothetical protein
MSLSRKNPGKGKEHVEIRLVEMNEQTRQQIVAVVRLGAAC